MALPAKSAVCKLAAVDVSGICMRCFLTGSSEVHLIQTLSNEIQILNEACGLSKN